MLILKWKYWHYLNIKLSNFYSKLQSADVMFNLDVHNIKYIRYIFTSEHINLMHIILKITKNVYFAQSANKTQLLNFIYLFNCTARILNTESISADKIIF